MLTAGADPVRKVSIIPRGMALGVTLSTPDADRVSYSREDLDAKIDVALGGRVAEEVVYGAITTGAESDIQQLTHIARQMVGRWGMSDAIGPLAVLPSDGAGPLLPGVSETSPATAQLVDEEVRRIASGSSMKTIDGAAARACLKRSRTRDAPTPTIASMNSDAEIEKNAACASPATARASSVFPVPGGP